METTSVSNLIVEDDLFEAHLQEMNTEAGSGHDVGEDEEESGSVKVKNISV